MCTDVYVLIFHVNIDTYINIYMYIYVNICIHVHAHITCVQTCMLLFHVNISINLCRVLNTSVSVQTYRKYIYIDHVCVGPTQNVYNQSS